MSPSGPKAPGEWFDSARFAAALAKRKSTFGAALDAPLETNSTNDLALQAEKAGAPEGAVFVARAQIAGRGRRGNTWLASPGENLTFSVLSRPERGIETMLALPLIVGLAVREVVEARIVSVAGWLREPVLVKWPNDVLIGTRKVAGILLESRLRGSVVSAAVIGVGLNVLSDEFPEEIAGRATSLLRAIRSAAPGRSAAELASAELSFEELLAEILANLEGRYRTFLSAGLAPFLPELAQRDALQEQRVRIEGLEGIGSGVTEAGALRVVDAAGREHIVSSGHVELLGH